MKLLLALTTLLLGAVLLNAAAGNSNITYIDHEKVAKGGTLVTAPNLSVSISSRNGPGQVEVHDKETDSFYVLDGAATVVTGGTMIGGKVIAVGQQRGADIEGGETHHLSIRAQAQLAAAADTAQIDAPGRRRVRFTASTRRRVSRLPSLQCLWRHHSCH